MDSASARRETPLSLSVGDSAAALTVPLGKPALFQSESYRRLRAVGSLLAWADRARYWLMGGVIVLYLCGFNGQWRIEPDSALYLTLGRNLADGRGYTYLGDTNHLAYPGLPWLLAGAFKIFGDGALWPAHVMMLACGLLTLGLIYRLFRLHAGRPTAVIITFGVALTETFYRYCFEIRNDMPFLLGVTAFLCGYEALFFSPAAPTDPAGPAAAPPARRTLDWFLLGAGLILAVTMRPVMWGFLFAVAAASLLAAVRYGATVAAKSATPHPKRARRIIAVAIVAAAAVLVFWLMDPRRAGPAGDANAGGQYEYAALQSLTHPAAMFRKVRENLPRVVNPEIAEAVIGLQAPWLSPILSITLIALGIALIRRRAFWGLWIALTIVAMIYQPVERYLLAVLPLLLYAWWRAAVWINRRLPEPFAGWIFALLLGLWAAGNLVRIGSFLGEQRALPFITHYKHGRYVPAIAISHLIQSHAAESDFILAPDKFGRVLTYFSDRKVMDLGDNSDVIRSIVPNLQYLAADSDETLATMQQQFSLTVGPALPQPKADLPPHAWRLYPVLPTTSHHSPMPLAKPGAFQTESDQ